MTCHRCGSTMATTKWGTFLCVGCEFVSNEQDAPEEIHLDLDEDE